MSKEKFNFDLRDTKTPDEVIREYARKPSALTPRI